MKYKAPRGTQDILPDQVAAWQRLETVSRDLLDRYGYREIRTPVFEQKELFLRTVGQDTDIVQKEMYAFTDRKDRELALRPEGTAPVIRSYIEHSLGSERALQKLYYIGPMFRYDRPQKGRYRQFHQVGAEAVGSDSPLLDAEVIAMMDHLLREMGLKRLSLRLNSVGCPSCRPGYVQALKAFFSQSESRLCPDCKNRLQTNPLRVLDCKVESCKALMAGIPAMEDHLCRPCADHYRSVRTWLDTLGIRYVPDRRLVRGLDYYTRTAFEYHHGDLGAAEAVGGGGRYDSLVAQCGGPDTPAIGFSLGSERVLMAAEQDQPKEREEDKFKRIPGLYFAWQGQEFWNEMFSFILILRQSIRVEVSFEERSLKSQLRQADKLRLSHVAVVGGRELKERRVKIKDLGTGREEETGLFDGEKMIEIVKSYEDAPFSDLSFRSVDGVRTENLDHNK